MNCKFSSERSSSSQYLKLITGDQITNQSSFTLALVVKLGDITQRGVKNNFTLREPTEAKTHRFIAVMLLVRRSNFQITAACSSTSVRVPSSLNNKKVLLWIAKSGTTIKMSISNYGAQSIGSYSIDHPLNFIFSNSLIIH